MTNSDISKLQRDLVMRLRKEEALHSQAVEQAFLSVPRHLFLPEEPVEKVYSDIAIMVKKDEQGRWTSSSSQPAMMAIMLEQLDLQPGMRVLEIGTGTGFNAALIAELVGRQGRVVSVDIQPDLVDAACRRLEEAGYEWVEVIHGDGGYGYPEGAPYDRIILTVASPVITPAWWAQLGEGGSIVLPLEIFSSQKSVAFVRRGHSMESVSISDCGFMMLQGAFAPEYPQRVPLGPVPGVYLAGSSKSPLAHRQLYELLAGTIAWVDWATGVNASVSELWTGLMLWLAVHPVGTLTGLVAEGNRARPSVIPPLIYSGHGQDLRRMETLLVTSENGAAALVRPPGHAAPFRDWGNSSGDDRLWTIPFELYIRQFGLDTTLARQIRETIRDWDSAGRPTSSRLRLRAFPADGKVEVMENEHLVEKQWGNILVRFE